MFIKAFFVSAKNQKQFICPSVGHWFNKLYYVAIKKDKGDQQPGHRKITTKYCGVKHYLQKYVYRMNPFV